MKKRPTVIIVVIVGIGITIPLVWASIDLPPGQNFQNWPSDCGTTFTAISSDVAEYNITEIKQVIQQKFPEINGADYGAYRNWWDYVKIGEPNEDDTFDISVPGLFREDDKGHERIIEILEDLEQISKVTGIGSECF